MKKFDIPSQYRSSLTGRIKEIRRNQDPRKQDFAPTVLDFGSVVIYLARHFGFCYGVENAIEISYKAIEENPGKRVFLLSQIIHNPEVNQDLQDLGVRFILDTDGSSLISWEELKKEDIVIIPAFGTTVEIENRLLGLGLDVQRYNTTCPFVEKVWNRSIKLGEESYTVIIHGKPGHEETRATFSHSSKHSHSIVVRDMKEAQRLGEYIKGTKPIHDFHKTFAGQFSDGFDPIENLVRVGVVNQTTMLASETQGIAEYFKSIMMAKYGKENIRKHFADTRDTLCYATNDNQEATYKLLETPSDMAIVVGGYNSSNTAHLVELCEQKFPTYFIRSEKEIKSQTELHHFDLHHKKVLVKNGYLPERPITKIILTSGASCPDTLIDRVMLRLLEFFKTEKKVQDVINTL